jgi:hypothetical protein
MTETGKAIADLLKKEEMETNSEDEEQDEEAEDEGAQDWKQDEPVTKRPASTQQEPEPKKLKTPAEELVPTGGASLTEEHVRQVLLMAGKIPPRKLVDILKSKGLLETKLDKDRLAGFVGRLATMFQDGNEKYLLLRDEFRLRPGK